ncbi:hypothetical protein NUW54_g14461 [Trametes sanguinea]|uniref:Uncharacterized protein n=1 Tax=Trametes sanguinea TaxID=158606 RepID=A0ACC1MD65_9APHY|nr:hypothetical protein NUW54_g14461 [Trametes sanguinea]
MSDGETLERVWAITNALARRTKEMSAGHRHDILNDHYSDMNLRRLQHMVDDLVKYLEVAEARLTSANEYITDVEKSLESNPDVDLDAWRREEREWQAKVLDITKHKNLENPYEPPREVALSTKAIAESLKAERVVHHGAEATGIVGAVEQVIRIREQSMALRKKVVAFKGGEKARTRMAEEMETFRRQRKACQEDYEACIKPILDAVLKDLDDREFGDSFPARDSSDDTACGIPALPSVEQASKPAFAARGAAADVATGWYDEASDIAFLLPSDMHSAARQTRRWTSCASISQRTYR